MLPFLQSHFCLVLCVLICVSELTTNVRILFSSAHFIVGCLLVLDIVFIAHNIYVHTNMKKFYDDLSLDHFRMSVFLSMVVEMAFVDVVFVVLLVVATVTFRWYIIFAF